MRLSRRIMLQLVEWPRQFVLLDEATGREVVIPGSTVAKLLAVIRGFLTDAAPDGLDVLAFDEAAGEPGYRVETRAIPTGRSIELPHPTAVHLADALDGYFRPYWDTNT